MTWQKAKDAAWRAFGARHYRLVLGVEFARRVAPFALAALAVAGLVGGVVWIVRHARLPHVAVPGMGGVLLALLAAGLVVGIVAGWRYVDPMALRTWGHKALAGLAAVGAAMLVWLWRGAS